MGRKQLERVSQREYARRLGVSNEAVSRAIKEGRIMKGWDKGAGKIVVEHANAEWGLLHMKTNVTQVLQQEVGEDQPAAQDNQVSTGTSMEGAEVTNGSTDKLILNEKTSFGEAKRIREIIEAQKAGLELKELKGELVRKDNVYSALFSFGQELRVALMAIPDRNIDLILSAKNRTEAHQLLVGEIHAVLDSITKADFNFQPRK